LLQSTCGALYIYIMVLWLAYGQQRDEVPTLSRATKEAVQPCPRHSLTSFICISPWFSQDTACFPRLHDSRDTTSSAGPDCNGSAIACTRVHYQSASAVNYHWCHRLVIADGVK